MSRKKIISKTSVLAILLLLGFGTFMAFAVPAPVCVSKDLDGDGNEDGSICAVGASDISPYDDKTGVGLADTLSVTFSDAGVSASSGNLYLVNDTAASTLTIPCSTLTKVGSTFSYVMALNVDSIYHIIWDLFCFSNSTVVSDVTAWNFSTSNDITLLSSTPVDGSSNNCYTQGLTLNFDQPVNSNQLGATGLITVSCDGKTLFTELCEPGTFQGSGTNTLIKDIQFRQSANCKVVIDDKCIHNDSGIFWTGDRIEFSTNATECSGGVCTPIIFDPSDDAVGVRQDTNVSLQMPSEIMLYHDYYDVAVATDIDIYRTVGNVLYDSYQIREDNLVAGAGKVGLSSDKTKLIIDPDANLPANTAFHVHVRDLMTRSCPIYNINDSVTWNFTTGAVAPIQLMEKFPRNNRLNVAGLDTYFEMRFDNPVFTGAGSVRVYKKDGDVLIDTIPAGDPRVQITGDIVRIFPINGLEYRVDYYVLADEGFVNGGAPTMPSAEITKEAPDELKIWWFRLIQKKEIPFFKFWTDDR